MVLRLFSITPPYRQRNKNLPYHVTLEMFRTMKFQGKHVLGEKLPIKDMVEDAKNRKKEFFSPMHKAKSCISFLRQQIEKMKRGDFGEYRMMPKRAMYIVKCEAQIEHAWEFDPGFRRLYKHMKNIQGHIINDCYKYRRKKDFSKEEAKAFSQKLEEYIKECKEKINSGKWS